ncbi:hypothetical protein CsSME_00019650 [Camellia sinensis var. sinensis]
MTSPSSVAPPPAYVMLSEDNNNSDHHGSNLRPPPYRRNVPRYHSAHHPKKRTNCCLKCICCCCCFIILFLLILVSLVFYFYTFYKPQMPSYQVQGLTVQAFSLQPDFSLVSEFLINVKADNPNDHIGFIYGKDNSVVVAYEDSTLSSGKLPSFHQGHNNATMMNVLLKGKSEFGSGLQEALMQNRNSGKIPLLVLVKVPVSLILAEIPMRHFVVFVNCSLVVDNLSPNKKIRILSSKYNVAFSI